MKVVSTISVMLAFACRGATTGSVMPLPCPESMVPVPASVAEFIAPRPLRRFLPPLPPPASVRGQHVRARVLVDSSGSAVRDSITVCGISDASYAREIARTLGRLTFEPARRQGVALSAPAYFEFRF